MQRKRKIRAVVHWECYTCSEDCKTRSRLSLRLQGVGGRAEERGAYRPDCSSSNYCYTLAEPLKETCLGTASRRKPPLKMPQQFTQQDHESRLSGTRVAKIHAERTNRRGAWLGGAPGTTFQSHVQTLTSKESHGPTDEHPISSLVTSSALAGQQAPSRALTCFMAVSPIFSECLRMLSRKSLRSDMETSRIWVRSSGMFSAMMPQNRYWPAWGRQECSSCSRVRNAG